MANLIPRVGVPRRRRSSRPLKPDTPTVALAALAVATAGTVIGGELIRLARRRKRTEDEAATLFDATAVATRDTARVAAAGYDKTPRHETILFNTLTGFTGAFALMRLATWGQREGWWPTGPLTVGGRHIHHFVPGILIGFGAGGAGLATSDDRAEEVLAFVFGVGAGLTFDEAALLLDLRDVYWTHEGLVSVQVSFGVAVVLAVTILGLRIFRRGEEEAVERGYIPGLSGESQVHAAAGAGALS